MNLQSEFLTFHNKIKLDDENVTLREKRNILLDKLKRNIADDAASYTTFNQGSYAMGTGIKPEKEDYDIDVGLKFNIDKDDYDPLTIKKWVKDALDGHTKSVKIRRSCVTVTYQENGEAAYHVDFAAYAANNGDGKMYIAKGKEKSNVENKYWEVSCPQELIDKINSKYDDAEDKAQFKRSIRYLKKWKSHNFSALGNAAPTGISLTVLAYNHFDFSKKTDYISGKVSYDDLDALIHLVSKIKQSFSMKYSLEDNKYYHVIKVSLIVEPYNDLFEKMTDRQMEDLYDKVCQLSSDLQKAASENKKDKACEVLQGIWGEEFPITYDRSIVGTSESA